MQVWVLEVEKGYQGGRVAPCLSLVAALTSADKHRTR